MRALIVMVAGAWAAVALSGCTGMSTADQGAPCLDDSPRCVDARTVAFKHMQDDQSRGWINAPVSAQVHASGVRMFAYRATKERLTCAELNTGMNEMSAVHASLSGTVAGASKDRLVQAKMLADETHAELKKIHQKKKCA